MRVRNHGKYTKMNMKDPRGIGTCDYSGLMVQQAQMVDQYVYRGQGLVKTGYRVNPKFYDQPNAQDLTPLIKLDPVPIINARPDSQVDTIQPQILILNVGGSSDVTLTETQFSNINFIFNGSLSGDVIISVPATFNDFFVCDQTTGPYTLSMQIINNYATRIVLVRDVQMLISNDSMSLKIIHPS